MTGIDRRRLFAGAIGLAGLTLPARVLGVGQVEAQLFAACAKDRQGRFSAVVFDPETGRAVRSVILPERGHDIAVQPRREGVASQDCIAFARQPGNFAVVVDARESVGESSGDPPRGPLWFTSRNDRHFHGHGVFSRDGRLLYTTENDFDAGQGVIGVRDAAARYRQIGEFPSGGIDPHDLELLGDGRTLVVANGGIKTHPADPRRELNLATMQPNLAYIDTATGDLMERQELPGALHQLSIRHLSVGVRDTVLFGCQFRGPRWQTQAIVGRHRRGGRIALLDMPGNVQLAMRNYVASVAVDTHGETGIITAPFGGLAVAIDMTSGRYVKHATLDNVFGAAAGTSGGDAGGTFILTSGNGPVATMPATSVTAASGTAATSRQLHAPGIVAAWDNHLTVVR